MNRKKSTTGRDTQAALLKCSTLGVEDLDFAEEGGLGFDLRAVAREDDLHIGGVEIFSRRREHFFRSDGAHFGAIRLEIVVGQFVLRDGGELAEQAVLRCKP